KPVSVTIAPSSYRVILKKGSKKSSEPYIPFLFFTDAGLRGFSRLSSRLILNFRQLSFLLYLPICPLSSLRRCIAVCALPRRIFLKCNTPLSPCSKVSRRL